MYFDSTVKTFMKVCGSLHGFSMPTLLSMFIHEPAQAISELELHGEMNMSASVIYRVAAMISIAVLSLTAAVRPARAATTEVTLTGSVSCAHCQGVLLPKAWTQYRWALYSVDHGDDIVLVVKDKSYKLKGDKDELLKFMSARKATVTGHLDGSALEVETIGRAVKNK
jgi:hypothetical protein